MIHNLYFVGAGTHPGAGIPSVVASAKATAGLMIEDLRLSGSSPIDPLTERHPRPGQLPSISRARPLSRSTAAEWQSEVGSASRRERESMYVELSGVAVT